MATITLLFMVPVYPPPPYPTLEDFVGNGRGYDCIDAQPNYPQIFQTALHVYRYSSDFPREIL